MPRVGDTHQAQYLVSKSFAVPGGPDYDGARPVYGGITDIPSAKQLSPLFEQVGDPEFAQEILEQGAQADIGNRVGVQFGNGRLTGLLIRQYRTIVDIPGIRVKIARDALCPVEAPFAEPHRYPHRPSMDSFMQKSGSSTDFQ